MSLFKLAVYGGIGYLVYQMFFSDTAGGGDRMGLRRGSREGDEADQGDRRGEQRFSGGGGRSDRGQQSERTEEPSGMSSGHRVGRGVVT
jgi:hypothetical protein